MAGGEFRRAGPQDAAAVRALTRRAYAKWVPVIGREPRPMTADYDQAVRDHRVDMLFDGAEMVGCIEMRADADHLMIINVAVAPERQRQALGRTLLAHAEAVARKHRLEEIRLYTNGAMAGNVAMYGRRGYAVEREELHPTLGTVVHMRKRLA